MNDTILARLAAISRSLTDIIVELSMNPPTPPATAALNNIQAMLDAAKGNPELEKLITRRAAAANVAARYDEQMGLPTATRSVRSKIAFGADPGEPYQSPPVPQNGTAAAAAGVSNGK